jgi:hypothetical protein
MVAMDNGVLVLDAISLASDALKPNFPRTVPIFQLSLIVGSSTVLVFVGYSSRL